MNQETLSKRKQHLKWAASIMIACVSGPSYAHFAIHESIVMKNMIKK